MTKTRTRKAVSLQPVRQRMHYTEQDKIRAVTIAISMGGMTYEAMETIRQTLNNNKLSYTCLHKWIKKYKQQVLATNPAMRPASLETTVITTRDKLLQNMTEAVVKYSAHVNDDAVVAETKGRDAGVVLGILVDKLEAMLGVSPDEAAMVRRARVIATAMGRNHLELMKEYWDYIETQLPAIETTTQQISAQTVDG